MSYPCLFGEVDCDREVFFLCLSSVHLCIIGAGLSRCCHSNALLLCLLLVFFYFLLRTSTRINEMMLDQLGPKQLQ